MQSTGSQRNPAGRVSPSPFVTNEEYCHEDQESSGCELHLWQCLQEMKLASADEMEWRKSLPGNAQRKKGVLRRERRISPFGLTSAGSNQTKSSKTQCKQLSYSPFPILHIGRGGCCGMTEVHVVVESSDEAQ
jgi:hypothetical protein